MKWNDELHNKWISLSQLGHQGIAWRFFEKCVLVGYDRQHQAQGFVIVEGLGALQKIASRVEARAKSNDLYRYDCFAPPAMADDARRLFGDLGSVPVNTTATPFIEVRCQNQSFAARHRVRVANVDDSQVVLKLLARCLEDIPWIELVAQFSEPARAVAELPSLSPDVITLDIQMPIMNGVEVAKRLLREQYVPIVLVSSLNLAEGSLVIDALNAGAFDYLQKPEFGAHDTFKGELVQRISLAIRGDHRRSWQGRQQRSSLPKPRLTTQLHNGKLIWAFGASTGGIQALTTVFTSLPTSIPPTLVVQHIPPHFSRSFAESLNALCPFLVKEAEDGELLANDVVYIAPGGRHMAVRPTGGGLGISLTDDPPVNRFRPSVDYLFASLEQVTGWSVIAGIFTGMGRDGAEGLLKLKHHGAKTLAQDEASSTVYGMPRAAIELGAADQIAGLEDIPQVILQLSQLANTRKAG